MINSRNHFKQFVYFIVLCSLCFTPVSAEKPRDPDMKQLQGHIDYIANVIGARVTGTEAVTQTQQYITDNLKKYGYHPNYQDFRLPSNRTARNMMAYCPGTSNRELILMVHLDTPPGTPGASYNAAAIALFLELARQLKDQSLPDGVQFVFLGADEKAASNDGEYYYSAGVYVEYQKKLGIEIPNGIIYLGSIGNGKQLSAQQVENRPGGMMERAIKTADQLSLPIRHSTIKPPQDTMPLEDTGVSTLWLSWESEKTVKPKEDRPDKVSRIALEQTFQFLFQFIKNGN